MAQIIFENFDEKKLEQKEQVLTILQKMLAIQNNLKDIDEKLFDTEEMQIVIDFDNQYDEFWIDAEPKNNDRKAIYIEVTNERNAIDTDLSHLNTEQKKEYVFCRYLSDYKKLGNGENKDSFYFREL